MDHLEEAKMRVARADGVNGAEWAQFNAQLAIAHALIVIAERLPPPTETASARHVRLQKEEHDAKIQD